MRAKTFSGGYKFQRFDSCVQNELITLGNPDEVVIPLSQGFGTPSKSLVQVGDKVYAGQIIARDDDKISSPIHSSVEGTVLKIQKINYFKREVDMVFIKTINGSNSKKIEGATDKWDKLSNEKIEKLLYESGVTSLDREGIPTHSKSAIITPEEIEDLIIHGVGSEAYNLSLSVLLKGKNLFNFVEGIKILKKIMPKARIHLAINRDEKG